MGSSGNALLAGLGAGLTNLSQGLMQQKATEKADQLEKQKQDREERRLKIQEQDAENRRQNAEMKAIMDRTKMKHMNLTRDLSFAGNNMNERAAAFSKYHPDKRQYTVNNAAREELIKRLGKDVFAVWDVTYNETDENGELVMDETTGKVKQKSSPAGPMIFHTSDDFANWQAKIMNPDLFLAYESQGLTDKMALDQARKLYEQRMGTEMGKAELVDKQASGDLKTAKAEALRKETKEGPKSDKPTGSVENLSGETVSLTTPEQNRLINDTKSLKEIIPGITSGETYRFMEGMRNPEKQQELAGLAQAVKNEKINKQDAINGIMTDYGMSKNAASAILDEQMAGLEQEKLGLIDRVKSWF